MISPEKRILLAAINLAVVDSCIQPLKPSDIKEKNRKYYAMVLYEDQEWGFHRDARSAMNFLHGNGLDMYCKFLEFDPDYLRSRLDKFMSSTAQQMKLSSGEKLAPFDGSSRRFYRFNYKLWRSMPHQVVSYEEDDGLTNKEEMYATH